jgi:hypothetical protein
MAASRIAKKGYGDREAAQMERLFQKAKRAPAPMTKEQIEEIEDRELDARRHTWRRVAMGTLIMSGPDLFGKVEADREAAVLFGEVAVGVGHYLKRMRALIEVLEVAQNRIELALCARDDWKQIIAEAKREYEAEPDAAEPEVAHA